MDDFSHKALSAIADSIRVHVEVLEQRRAALPEDDEDESSDLFNDIHYLRMLLDEVEARIERVVASLGTS